MIGIGALVAGLAGLLVLLRPRLTGADSWRAVATPLASIIGSGFLVSVPILDRLVGSYAVLAMLGLLAVAYGVGFAIRDNIVHVEPLTEQDGHGGLVRLDRVSEYVLAVAYFISVAFYLVLFGSFLLEPFGVSDGLAVRIVVSICLLLLGGIGGIWGFRAVEGMEIYAVSLKLAVIAGLVVGLLLADVAALGSGWRIPPGQVSLSSLPELLGLLILVQGFETSRYLGDRYPAALRVKTMAWAQGLAALIYVGFFLAILPVARPEGGSEGVSAIAQMLRAVSPVLALMVIGGALASQSSAAIADALGAGGLLHEASHGRIGKRQVYPIVALVAGALVWLTDIYALIALASRAFALYYALQTGLATWSAARRGAWGRALLFAALTLACGAVVLFGAPAEGG